MVVVVVVVTEGLAENNRRVGENKSFSLKNCMNKIFKKISPAPQNWDKAGITWDDGQVVVNRQTPPRPASSGAAASASLVSSVRSARDRHEQNMELCREGGVLRVLTLRTLHKGDNLLIWYGEQLAREVGVPFLTTAHIRGSNEYTCTSCRAVFAFPNALKAHILLQCSDSKSRVCPKPEELPLVPFDRLLHRLHKSSKTSRRKRQEQSQKHKSSSTACDTLEAKTEKRFSKLEHRPEKDNSHFSEAVWTHKDKLCSSNSHQGDKLYHDRSAFRRPTTSKDGSCISHVPEAWSSPPSSTSPRVSLSPFSSPPPGDNSMKMSPDSSTDQSSALNLSVRVSSCGLTPPMSGPLVPNMRQLHPKPDVQPSYPSLTQWSRALTANNILAQTFASLPMPALDAAYTCTGTMCLPNVLPFGQASFLADQYYHGYHLDQHGTRPEALSSLKQQALCATNSGIIPLQSYHSYHQYKQAFSIRHMEELQRHHQSQRHRNHHKHYRCQRQHEHQENPQQRKLELNKSLLMSPPACSTPPGLVRNNEGPSSAPSQAQHKRLQQHQVHPSPRTSGSNIFGLTLPSDKEPLDLLPQAYFANKSKKGHLCIYCGKVYSRKYGLKIHMRTHNGYKPLKCKICSRPFGDPSNLNKHVRLHAQGETPYRCDYCGKVLVRRRDLERHIKSRHPNGTCTTSAEGNDVEGEDWEEQKGEDDSDDVIDVASVNEELSPPESTMSS
ncbi:PR domain zinc finger protein 13 [Elysia marginata]|uniref:PR domain zinc finger protein 13 n=1 Tax=Elysia marginata TaxID=1093978 RepID=A0AAV4JS87_9GAST|nr:PR domain zinc finger protein 13 [Elysia marginata]